MKIIEIKNMLRKEFPIYYRRFYSGIAVIEFMNNSMELPLDFQIEQKPTGHIDINIKFTQNVDYPLIPLLRELKKFIGALDSNGMLPHECG